MELIVLRIVAFAASALTLFSGFDLGTLLKSGRRDQNHVDPFHRVSEAQFP